MDKQLENFINDNRGAFDSEEMNRGFEELKLTNVNKSPVSKIKSVIWAAAAAVTLFISGAVFYKNMYNTQIQEPASVVLPAKELTDEVDPDYTDQMDKFAHLIKIRQEELSDNKSIQPTLYNKFVKDNYLLDSSYNFLKSQLGANPNKEIILDAMIENLRLKIQILDKQLHVIKQLKQKNTNNENKTI